MLQAVLQLWPLKNANLVEVRKTVNRSPGENDNFFSEAVFSVSRPARENRDPGRRLSVL